MAYIITGATQIGTTSLQNNILGNTILTDSGSTSRGTVYYANASGYLTALVPGTAGQVLQTNGVGADPVWASVSASLVTTGCSVAKDAGWFFSNAYTDIGNWNITGPGGMTINPYFNTGGSLNLATGEFTAPQTGAYSVDVLIEYTNTTNSGNKTIVFAEKGIGPTYYNILTSGPLQPSGDINTDQVIRLHGTVRLAAGAVYVARIFCSNSFGANAITTFSRLNIVLSST